MRSSLWMLVASLLLTACSSVPGSGGTTEGEEDGSIRPFPTDTGDDDTSQGGDAGDDAGTGEDADAEDDGQGGGDADAAGPTDAGDDTGADPDSTASDSGAGDDSGTDADDSDGSGAVDADGGVDADAGDGTGGVCGSDFADAENATLPVDMIWVIDGSPSMDDSIAIVEANLNAFTARIGASEIRPERW